MQYIVYYLYSQSLDKYYIGKTERMITKRLKEHNRGKVPFTSKGKPWAMIGYIICRDSRESTLLEIRLKKAKNKKYVKWYIEKHGLVDK